MTNKLRHGTPVFIEWDDSASFGGWRGDTQGMKTGQVKSIGFVFGVKDDGVILTTSLAKPPQDPDIIAALDTLIIPHGCIRRIQVLELKGERFPIQIEGVLATDEPEDEQTITAVYGAITREEEHETPAELDTG